MPNKFSNRKRRLKQYGRMNWKHWRRFLGFMIFGKDNPILYLYVFLFVSLLVAVFLSCLTAPEKSLPGIIKWMFLCLFDINTVINTQGLRSAVSYLLFFFTWMLGSGVLFSLIVARCIEYRQGRRKGLIHHDFGKEKNHVIILGWDDNVPTLINELDEYNKVVMTDDRIIRVAIITKQHVQSLRKLLMVFAIDSDIHVSICNGLYDDIETLISDYSIEKAHELYIIGEPGEDGHDAKMLNLVASLNSSPNLGNCVSLPVAHVKINSFLLFDRLVRNRAEDDRSLLVDYFNFYDNWSKRIWSMLPTKRANAYPEIRFLGGRSTRKSIKVVIVGFSSMGQALALEAMRVAHYGDDARTCVVVLDDHKGSERINGFLREYPDMDKLGEKIQFKYKIINGSFHSEEFIKELNGCTDEDSQISIMLTMSDSSMSLELMQDILELFKGRRLTYNLYVRLDMFSSNVENPEDKAIDLPGCKNVWYFGFKNGAGFNAWRRERLAMAIFSNRKNSGSHGNKFKSIYRKGTFRLRVDSFKEWFHSVGLGLVDENNPENDIIIAEETKKILALATHRRWVAERKMNRESRPNKPCPSYTNDIRYKDEFTDTDIKQVEESPKFLSETGYKIIESRHMS